MKVEIKPATIKDAQLILEMIIELADYEKARHEVKASVTDIEISLFGENSNTEALICYVDDKPAGYAVFFTSYSTWLGNNGIYLEDLYVSPEYRGAGAGKKLLKHIAIIACERKCQRLEWSVLDWNQPAIDFYKSIGAQPQDEWVRYRMDEQTIAKFAN
ncbi:GNAT family N-acetyltransferase [Providencia burhodogranariea]|uniref:GCN5-like N-acetyltransferase n=1 Tax=Providencia burhodogranariea DSM 19968 TaxID=1141662 RepID=K8WRV4_9GAMM|nr:GNAT family N-acetyltransferase [Providencia burhodogranariea]EKT62696.1 GCN5-like N-acetyltransferase [Providencia burhodogranariea DSM 19968]